MRVKSAIEASLRGLRLGAIRPYVEMHGWMRRDVPIDYIAIFGRDDDQLAQLQVPTKPEFDDFTLQMKKVVQRLAEWQQTSPDVVLSDLMSLDTDTLRFSIQSPDTERGTVPLDDGLSLIEGAKRSLLSAACTVLAPTNTFHPRMTRTEASEFVEACELGQTEIGSFTVTVRCPLALPDPNPEALTAHADATPFARRATETLVDSIGHLVNAIDQDRIESALRPTSAGHQVTANLCEALLRMQPERENAALGFSVAWSPSQAPRVSREPIFLRRDHFPKIQEVSKELRSTESRQIELLVAQVDAMNGGLLANDRRSGEVRLTIYDEEEAIKARVMLSADQYEIANTAHMNGGYVVVRARLVRGSRTSVLTEVESFLPLTEAARALDSPI